MITQRRAYQLVRSHGFEPYQPTEYDPQSERWIPYTSFIDKFGIEEWYPKQAILLWLGF